MVDLVVNAPLASLKFFFFIWFACIVLISNKDSKNIYGSKNYYAPNELVIANFSLFFHNSEFLMKIKFPSYVTQKFYIYLITPKFTSYTTPEFKFH